VQRKNDEPNRVKTSCKTEKIDKETLLILGFDSPENEPKSTRILRYLSLVALLVQKYKY
jgi:hypothetical protein